MEAPPATITGVKPLTPRFRPFGRRGASAAPKAETTATQDGPQKTGGEIAREMREKLKGPKKKREIFSRSR